VRVAAALIDEASGRLRVVEAPFSEMEAVAQEELGGERPDGVVLDIGVSSMQLDDPARGFSFQHDGPLDMRMSASGETAADFVNGAEEEEIANVIYAFGEERKSRAIARAIVKRRAETPFTRTLELADVVARVFHGRKVDGRHPATRTFQALRIFVNDELGELASGLSAAERILKPGGRLVVVSFHSLEDRIVKKFLAERSGKAASVSRHIPQESIKSEPPSFRLVNSRPLTPSKGELDVNPRARSARLRAAIRTDAAPWPLDVETFGVPRPKS
jgi:16S rRNA (cytosine1402-N4)-methyltransferase